MIINHKDFVGTFRNGNITEGMYIDRWIKENLDGIPSFLKKSWDVVGIVSGHGKVRIGKSTMALQIAYYIAWILAGGKVIANEDGKVMEIIPPKKEVKWSLDNVVFSPDELMATAQKLPKGSVIVYDEVRAGLDSARAMESINKGMQDFFQECGVLGHVIIIVLPSFFKLHEDFAIARSLFLIDVYADKKFNRGPFAFYNETQKEWLYYLGKKKIGISAKYHSARSSFIGSFSSWMNLDRETYDKKKTDAIKKKRQTGLQKKFKKQRDAAIYLAKKHSEYTHEDLARELSALSNSKVTAQVIKYALASITHDAFDKDE